MKYENYIYIYFFYYIKIWKLNVILNMYNVILNIINAFLMTTYWNNLCIKERKKRILFYIFFTILILKLGNNILNFLKIFAIWTSENSMVNFIFAFDRSTLSLKVRLRLTTLETKRFLSTSMSSGKAQIKL